MDGNGQTRTAAEIFADFGLIGQIQVDTPYDSFSPSWQIWRTGTSLIVLIGGCQTFNHGNAIFDNWLRADPDTAAFNARGVYGYTAGLIIAALAPLQGNLDQIFVYGHSYGGAIAEVMVNQWWRTSARPADRVAGVSIGAPRPFCGAGLPELADFVRYFRPDDPVPLIVPHADESPASHYLLTARRSQQWNMGTFITPGVEVSAGGTPTPRYTPSEAATSPGANILQWITQCMVGPTPQHSWQAYRPRMISLLTDAGRAANAMQARGNYVPQQPMTASNRSRAVRQAYEDFVGNSNPPAAARGSLGKDYLFTVQKVGALYYLNFRGFPLATFAKSRSARYAASGGNRLVRSFVKMGQSGGDEWTRAFQSFLSDVSSEDTAFPVVVSLSSELTGDGGMVQF